LKSNVASSSSVSDAAVRSGSPVRAACSKAARYTNGLNTDPGWRRDAAARLNCDWL
jgi:V8-like Glu-specific endopeptidase